METNNEYRGEEDSKRGEPNSKAAKLKALCYSSQIVGNQVLRIMFFGTNRYVF